MYICQYSTFDNLHILLSVFTEFSISETFCTFEIFIPFNFLFLSPKSANCSHKSILYGIYYYWLELWGSMFGIMILYRKLPIWCITIFFFQGRLHRPCVHEGCNCSCSNEGCLRFTCTRLFSAIRRLVWTWLWIRTLPQLQPWSWLWFGLQWIQWIHRLRPRIFWIFRLWSWIFRLWYWIRSRVVRSLILCPKTSHVCVHKSRY